MNTNREKVSVRGYVDALPRSHQEESARVAVITADGVAYHVAHKAAGADLADHIGADVEITGAAVPLNVSDEAEGKVFSILVRGYRLRDELEDSWYDDTAE